MISTGFKVPVYLGSSFAFITAMSLAMKEMGGDVSAAQTGGYLDWFSLCSCRRQVFVLQVEMD